MVVDAEVEFRKFGESLRLAEEKAVFEDLVAQCRVYASAASAMASPVKEFPLFFSMLFAQHKKILALERLVLSIATPDRLEEPAGPSLSKHASRERPFQL